MDQSPILRPSRFDIFQWVEQCHAVHRSSSRCFPWVPFLAGVEPLCFLGRGRRKNMAKFPLFFTKVPRGWWKHRFEKRSVQSMRICPTTIQIAMLEKGEISCLITIASSDMKGGLADLWMIRSQFITQTWYHTNAPNSLVTQDAVTIPPRKLTCHLKRDHFKRKFHLPPINFQGIILLVFKGVVFFQRLVFGVSLHFGWVGCLLMTETRLKPSWKGLCSIHNNLRIETPPKNRIEGSHPVLLNKILGGPSLS